MPRDASGRARGARLTYVAAALAALRNLKVHTSQPLDVALDGEVTGTAPGDFEVAGEALRVVTPLDFQAVDD